MIKETPGARTRAAMAEAQSMARTRNFKETVAARVQDDPAFAQALLDEAITLFVNGEPESVWRVLQGQRDIPAWMRDPEGI